MAYFVATDHFAQTYDDAYTVTVSASQHATITILTRRNKTIIIII